MSEKGNFLNDINILLGSTPYYDCSDIKISPEKPINISKETLKQANELSRSLDITLKGKCIPKLLFILKGYQITQLVDDKLSEDILYIFNPPSTVNKLIKYVKIMFFSGENYVHVVLSIYDNIIRSYYIRGDNDD